MTNTCGVSGQGSLTLLVAWRKQEYTQRRSAPRSHLSWISYMYLHICCSGLTRTSDQMLVRKWPASSGSGGEMWLCLTGRRWTKCIIWVTDTDMVDRFEIERRYWMKVAVSVPSYQVTSPATCPWLGTRLDYTPDCRHLPLERERGVTSSVCKLLLIQTWGNRKSQWFADYIILCNSTAIWSLIMKSRKGRFDNLAYVLYWYFKTSH